MTPLARWIIGPVKKSGFDCLKVAVDNFTRLHPEFDTLICHNQLDEKSINELEKLGIPLFAQTYTNGIEPKGVAWKLYPPRLRPNAHELVMDNDIVLVEKIPEIEEFLSRDCILYYESSRRSYGSFDKFVPNCIYLNSGFYGMPPGFNFETKLTSLFEQSGLTEWTNSCNQGRYTWDEQGIVAAALSNYKEHIRISLTQVTNCELDLIQGKGFHFVGLNRYTKHKAWRDWIEKNSRLLL